MGLGLDFELQFWEREKHLGHVIVHGRLLQQKLGLQVVDVDNLVIARLDFCSDFFESAGDNVVGDLPLPFNLGAVLDDIDVRLLLGREPAMLRRIRLENVVDAVLFELGERHRRIIPEF